MKNITLSLSLLIKIILLTLVIPACDTTHELSEEDFDFDGPLGSEGAVIEKIDKNVFRVTLGHAPNQPEWNNKLNFHIKNNAKGNNLVLVVEGPPKFAMNEYFYSWSYDMENWNPVHWKLGYRINPDRDTLVFPEFQQNQVWVGHQVPISYEQVEAYISEINGSESVSVDTLGQSLGGRNLYRITITGNTGEISAHDKWVHYFINLHPGEHNAQWRMIGKIDWLLSPEGEDFRNRSICHFVLMISPDGPRNGWYRVNAQGIDMNRSYFPEGADSLNQAHESYIFQKDLEELMASDSPVTTLWGHHTWGGITEPLLYLAEDENSVRWTEWRDLMAGLDTDSLIKPLAIRDVKPGYGATSWEYGPHVQFGITTILCEGGGAIYTKEENKKSGRILIESLARFYKGHKNEKPVI